LCGREQDRPQLMRIPLGSHAGGAVGAEDLLAYYAQRAHEYEQIYEKPERQLDLSRLRSWLRDALAGHRILEIACGTGYWTSAVASVAAAITATDASPEVLALARRKQYPPDRVQFEMADAYALDRVDGEFTAGFAAFWWSHVPRERQSMFLSGLHRRLGIGAVVVLMDNRFVDGSSTAISRRDAAGNTYQQRRLADGTTHEVLKNFPSSAEVKAAFWPLGAELSITELVYYWMVRYRVASAA
jgi:demethylmenaquinone methyltransferase/2-methoxy-6-polyprenyl-1,4-benzoquinol methylase